MAAAWQSAPIVDEPKQQPQEGSQPAWMSAPAVDEAPPAEEAPRGLKMPEEEVAQDKSSEPTSSGGAAGLLGVPAGSFTKEAQSAASDPERPAEAYPGWGDVVASDAFQQGDTRARHDLRQQYFREEIAPGLEGDERRRAEREFYSAPEADIRARLDESEWGRERPTAGDYAKATPSMVGEGAVGSFAAAIEGAGLIGEQAGLVEANRQVEDAVQRLETTEANMEEALAGTNDRFRDRVAGNYEAMLEKRQVELHEALTDWAEREPSKVAGWLRDRGVDLREVAQEIGPGEEFDGVYRDVAGGVGSMLSYMGPGMLAARLSSGASAGTQMAAGLLTSSAMAGPSGVTEQYQRAIAGGLPEEEAIETSMKGLPAGVIQVAPLASIIRPLPAELQGRALGQLYGILRTAGNEFAVENAGAIMQNLVEQSYNEERGTWDDTPYQGLVAGGSAAIIQAATLGLTRGRGGVGGASGRTGRSSEGETGLQMPDAASPEITPEATQAAEEVAAEIEAAAQETDTDPTPAQAEAGNYRKGKVTVDGFEIAIENPRGSTRRGTAPDGTEWESQMAHHYGDIKGTTAADGDNLDVFLGENPASESVFVIDQVNAEGRFDEHKVMMGFDSQEQAQQGYLANYEDGWQGLGAITEMPAEEFRTWVEEGDTTQPLALESAEGEADAEASDPLSQLIAADPADLGAQDAQARQQILSGDGYSLLRAQAEAAGNVDAVTAVDSMQALDNQAAEAEGSEAARLRNEAARAYAEARAALEGQPVTGLQMPETQAAEPAAPEAPAAPQQDVAAAPQAEPAADLLGDAIPSSPLEADAEPGALTPVRVPVERIRVDPEAYQFRTEVNERGVDDRMEGIRRWDDLRAGELVLHERTDGELYVADGHHRLDLARRLEQPGVNAFVLREADGYSVEDARRLAAERNIAGGSSTAIDAAKVFRNTEGDPAQVIEERDLPRRSQVVRDGADIARLQGEAFGAVLNAVVSEKDGAAIGRVFDDAGQQMAAIDVFRQVQPQNDNQRALLVNEIRQAGFADGQSDQMGMFGDDPMQSLIGERVRVMDRLRQELSRDRRLFTSLNTNAQTAEAAGNRIATERNEQLSDTAAQAIALLERATTTPEINQQINDAARRVSEGEAVAPVVRELKEALLRGPESEAAQQPVAPDPGRGPAEGRGQVERGDRRAPASDAARAEDAGEQRLAGAEAEAQGVTLKADGTPFQTERAVQLSKRFRDTPGAVAVEVDGGWGFAVQNAAQEAAAPVETAQAVDQPDVDAAGTPPQLVEETAIDRQVEAEPAPESRPMIAENTRETYRTWMQGGDRVDRLNGWDLFVAEDGDARLMTPYDFVGTFASEAEARRWAEAFPTDRSGFLRVDGEKVSDGFNMRPAPDVSAQAAPAESPQNDAESLTLETQTEESLAAREQETQAAEQTEAEQRRQEAQRAQADRDADDFLLTGSDSAADQAMARGQDSLFRLEPPADVAARRDAIAEAIGQHPELAGVQPVARVAELPATVQITMLVQGIDPRSVRGVFVGGELYVVAENVADTTEGVRVAVHEAVGHQGVRQVLGDRLAPVMNRLYLSFPRDHEVFQRVRERYPHLDTSTPEGRQEFAEELVAHLAETNPQVNAWQRFVAAVRDMLRQVFPEVTWTENDVRALIQRSRDTLAEQAFADGTFVAEEGDTRFSFAGERAETADLHSLQHAQEALEQGLDAEAVRRATGWFRGADGRWRFEIDDSDAGFLAYRDGIVGELWTESLDRVIDHPRLFAAYPDLRHLDVLSARGMDANGMYMRGSREIVLNANLDAMDQFSTLLHELQHAIQDVEGFATGSSPRRAASEVRSQIIDRMRERGDGAMLAEYRMRMRDYGIHSKAKRIVDLRNLSQPRQLFSASEWYQYRDQIVDVHGVPPRRGQERRQFAEQAAAWIANRLERDAPLEIKQLLVEYELDGRTDPRARNQDNRRLLNNAYRRAERRLNKIDREQLRANWADQQEVDRLSDVRGEEAYDLYRRMYGEVEARNVQERQHMSEAERAETAPSDTQDVADSDAIVIYNGREMASEPANASDDVRFSFAGERSRTVDTRRLENAERMLAEGVNSEEVRQATGWHQGQDGRWRYEISDDTAALRWFEEGVSDPGQFADWAHEAESRERGIPLGQALDHPSLFAAYPQLESVRLIVDEGLVYDGAYDHQQRAIMLRDPMGDRVLDTILHELQHAIQRVEDFATGAPPVRAGMLRGDADYARQRVNEMRSEAIQGNEEAYRDAVMALQPGEGADAPVRQLMDDATREEFDRWLDIDRDNSRRGLTTAPRDPMAAYRRLAGEVESRNVETRREMPPEQRRATPPEATQDVTDRDVLVIYNGDLMANAPRPANAMDQSGEDVLFNLGDQARRPAATEVQEGLRGIGGLGQPKVVESADSLALGVALEATVSGVNPQEAVAFYHGDQLYVVAGNAQDAGEAVRATVATVTGRQGLRQTIGNRADPTLRDALTAAQRHVAGRDAIRAVTAEFDHISMDHQADQMALATEVLARLSERSDPPAFVGEASQRLDALLQELYPEAGFATGDGAGLARTSHHHLAQQQRDFGEQRAPYALPFVFTAQDGPGRGSLLEFAPQVVDADGNIVSDARVDSAFQATRKAGLGFFESATDRLRRSGSPMLVELANRTDAYFDQAEARLGIINGMLRDPLRRLKSLNPLQQRRNMRDFEAYMRHRDNGRQAQADEVAASNPAVAELAEAVDAMFDRVGTINQTVKTPQGTGMRVFDSRIGAYRKVGKITKGQFWPRAMRPEVQRVMRDPTSNPTLWHELLDALIDEGHAETRKQAAEYLRGEKGYFSSDIANDYFAGIEKARGEKLPEIFYDYRFDVVTNYARKWSNRISQVEQFGQKIGPHAMDAFEQAITKAQDAQTQDYLQALSDRVYSRRPTDTYHEGMALANLAATGLQLGNPGTATLNLIGGTQLNTQMFGSRRMAQAYWELATEARQVFKDGVEMGILGKDILNILRDADNRNSEYMDANSRVKEQLSKFAAGTMKWGGYTGTEQVIRATGMIAARIQLMDALKAWNQSPYSKDARTYRAFMERNGFDVAKLIREGGKGEETARYLRRMVNTPQGSYRVDMTPLYVDTPIGRFMFKYQKFGTQVSRMFWQQKLKPFMDVVSDPGASGMDRARAFLPIMQWFGWAVIGGGAVLAARGAMFGYLDPGPELEEIAKAFEDDDTASAWGMVASKAHANLIAGSAYGFFGNYIQMGLDVADQQRVKNPFEPPGLAPIDAGVELVRRYLEQGRLYATDLDQVVERNLSIYRTSKRGLAAVGRQAGVESDFVALEQVRRDLQYVRKAARRFADETGIDATRTATGRFGLSENTAANRKIVDALLIGNGAQAREIIREELRNTAPEERQARLQSIRSTVRARQPVQLGGPASEAEVLAFRRWAKEKLPPSRAELVEQMIVNYERAKRQAGL